MALCSCLLSGSADHLVHAKNIAFWISEPCRLLGTEDADLLYGFQTGEIVIVENHPPGGQFAHRFRRISDFKAEGGVSRFGALRLREQRKRPAADREQMLPIPTLTGIRQPEYIRVEGPSAVGVDDRENGRHTRSTQHSASGDAELTPGTRNH